MTEIVLEHKILNSNSWAKQFLHDFGDKKIDLDRKQVTETESQQSPRCYLLDIPLY